MALDVENVVSGGVGGEEFCAEHALLKQRSRKLSPLRYVNKTRDLIQV
jgi:hypothetical protein